MRIALIRRRIPNCSRLSNTWPLPKCESWGKPPHQLHGSVESPAQQLRARPNIILRLPPRNQISFRQVQKDAKKPQLVSNWRSIFNWHSENFNYKAFVRVADYHLGRLWTSTFFLREIPSYYYLFSYCCWYWWPRSLLRQLHQQPARSRRIRQTNRTPRPKE